MLTQRTPERQHTKQERIATEPPGDGAPSAYDLRFRALIGEKGWSGLPAPVRRRFAKRLGYGQAAVYAGHILRCRITRGGWLLAQLARLVGAPLPLNRDTGGAAVVTVTEDAASGGQVWARAYSQQRGFPQIVHSSKRFAGPTGLEEYLGCGVGIALDVRADGGCLRFKSDHYFLQLGSLRLRLPRWLEPGALVIEHEELGGGAFTFSLSLAHRRFGGLIQQVALFQDTRIQDVRIGKGDYQ